MLANVHSLTGIPPLQLECFVEFAGLLADWFAVVCLVTRRLYRVFPVLSSYITFTAIGDTREVLFPPTDMTAEMRGHLVISVVEYALELGIALEFLRIVLKPTDHRLPHYITRLVCLAIMVSIALVGLLLTGGVVYHRVTRVVALFIRLELAESIVRLLVFFIVLLSIWMFCEFRNKFVVGAGGWLGGYFLVALIIQIAHEHQALGWYQYRYFYNLEAARGAAWTIMMTFVGLQVLWREETIPIEIPERSQTFR